MPRYGPPATYVPREYRSPYAGTIGQLLGQNNGAIWGNAINTLGGIASDAFREKAYRKQEDARHATEIGLIDAYKRGGASKEDFAKTLGKDGLSLWNGLESATALAEGRTRSAREDMKNVLEGFVNASSQQTQAMMYPELKRINSVAKLIPPDQVPDEWNPQTSEMVSGLYHSLVPKKEVQPLEINGQLVDPNTREVLGDYRNEPTPPALKSSTWVERGGKVIPIQPGMEQPGDRPYEKAPAGEGKAKFQLIDGMPYMLSSDGTAKPVKIEGAPARGSVSPTEAPFVSQKGYQKLPSAAKTQVNAAAGLILQARNYRKKLEDLGFDGTNWFGSDAAELDTLNQALLFTGAKGYGQGALQAPDKAVMERIFPNPTQIMSAPGIWMTQGKTGILRSVDAAIKSLENDLYNVYGLKMDGMGELEKGATVPKPAAPKKPGETLLQYLARTGGG